METKNFGEIYNKALDIRKGICYNINDFKYRKCSYCLQKTWRWTVMWQLVVTGGYNDWLWILNEQLPTWPNDVPLCKNEACPERIKVDPEHFSTYKTWLANELKI